MKFFYRSWPSACGPMRNIFLHQWATLASRSTVIFLVFACKIAVIRVGSQACESWFRSAVSETAGAPDAFRRWAPTLAHGGRSAQPAPLGGGEEGESSKTKAARLASPASLVFPACPLAAGFAEAPFQSSRSSAWRALPAALADPAGRLPGTPSVRPRHCARAAARFP